MLIIEYSTDNKTCVILTTFVVQRDRQQFCLSEVETDWLQLPKACLFTLNK